MKSKHSSKLLFMRTSVEGKPSVDTGTVLGNTPLGRELAAEIKQKISRLIRYDSQHRSSHPDEQPLEMYNFKS